MGFSKLVRKKICETDDGFATRGRARKTLDVAALHVEQDVIN
jgi:hypothetical protein